MDSPSRIENRLDSPYCPVSRQEVLRVFKSHLSAPAFQLYILLRFYAIDWKESESLGFVKITVREAKMFLGWSLDKTQTQFNELKDKGLLVLKSGGVWQVSRDGFPCSDGAEQITHGHNRPEAYRQPSSEKPEQVIPTEQNIFVPKNQNNLASKQGNHIRDKGEREEDVLRTDKEYQRIKEEHGFAELAIGDMKWIDQNIRDEPNFHAKTSDQLTTEEFLQIFPGATIEEHQDPELKEER